MMYVSNQMTIKGVLELTCQNMKGIIDLNGSEHLPALYWAQILPLQQPVG